MIRPDPIGWHDAATPEDMAANMARTRAEFAGMTAREIRQQEWREAYARHRDRGDEPEIAAERAGIEVRTARRERVENAAERFPLNPAIRSAHYGPGQSEAVSAKRAAQAEQAEMDFLADATAETGAGISPEQFAKNRKRRSKLREMSQQIAAMLGEAGVKAIRDDAAKTYAFYVHSRTFEELPAYRRICFLPEVAAAIRAPKLAALEFWLERHAYARFWTFTAGERVGLKQLEARMDWLHRKLSKLNHELRTRFGVEIVFRSTEFGTLERKSDTLAEREAGGGLEFSNGQPLFHPHAHCVVIAKFGYNPTKWRAACEFTRDYWRDERRRRLHCDFGEIIGSAREACKYVTKPADLLQLTPEQLRALYEITFRAKLCHPMGELAREIRIREGHTVEIENRGAAGNARQARTLRQLAAKHGVALATLAEQNPGLAADPDRMLPFGAKVVIHPGGKCLRRIRRGRRMVWVERLDHNKANRETEAEKAERIALEDAYAAREECLRIAHRPTPANCPAVALSSPEFIGPYPHEIAAGWRDCDAVPARAPHTGAATRVMARIMPAAGPSRVKEPRVIVLAVNGVLDRAAVESHPLVIGLWQDTVQAWEEGLEDAAREDAAARLLDSLQRPHRHTNCPGEAPEGPPEPIPAALEAERAAFNASAALAAGINF